MLYPHHPPSLLPLIRPLLPQSLALFGTVVLNTWPVSPKPGSSSELFGSAWCTFPTTSIPFPLPRPSPLTATIATTSTSSSLSTLSTQTQTPSLNGTFKPVSPSSLSTSPSTQSPSTSTLTPSSSLSTLPPSTSPTVPTANPDQWVMMIHLPHPTSYQLRLLTSLDNTPLSSLTPDQIESMQNLVQSSLREIKRLDPGLEILGGLNVKWLQGAERVDGVKLRNRCLTFIAPDSWGREYNLNPNHNQAQNGKERDGLRIDGGHQDDCQTIKQYRDSSAPIEYYIDRIPYTTVIRPSTSVTTDAITTTTTNTNNSATPDTTANTTNTPTTLDTDNTNDTTSINSKPIPPVAWIMTHTYGDMGALFTLPSHRRKGLAKWLVVERLQAMRQDGRQPIGWVVVKKGNLASEALWRGMGWQEGWECVWMTLSSDTDK
ncbi:hypothetical protein BCR39DRAFT_541117 [Naematelia encephala]|uniref:N-acetyltransferase domain-containing protein n=1 Tax=Naematelia encephala TaxID=71784 RepID=A0A1Y2AVF6_9TREE|nr:hypothetical protein BCR39DRAFT_541117 [Naematelia encephala]